LTFKNKIYNRFYPVITFMLYLSRNFDGRLPINNDDNKWRILNHGWGFFGRKSANDMRELIAIDPFHPTAWADALDWFFDDMSLWKLTLSDNSPFPEVIEPVETRSQLYYYTHALQEWSQKRVAHIVLSVDWVNFYEQENNSQCESLDGKIYPIEELRRLYPNVLLGDSSVISPIRIVWPNGESIYEDHGAYRTQLKYLTRDPEDRNRIWVFPLINNKREALKIVTDRIPSMIDSYQEYINRLVRPSR
jgi:hypothetical protein